MKWIDRHLVETGAMRDVWVWLNEKGVFPKVLVNLLYQRGMDDREKIQGYLRPEVGQLHDPFLMKDMDVAVERILGAIRKGEKILLYGDYDVDGTTSVTLMKLFFADWGMELDYYIPDRFVEGYGISYEGVDYAHAEGVGLIVALDCGTKAVDKIAYARERGIDVIVVDHHTVGNEKPVCVAMINPRQEDCRYPFKELPACGLALKLAQALESRLGELEELVQVPDGNGVLARYVDLVAMSIACDIVPLVGENRVLVSQGLTKLREAPLAGLGALMALAGNTRSWEVEDLIFFLGPRINSAGRLYSARAAVDLLLGKGPDIAQFAADLDAYNAERKAVEEGIHETALEMVKKEGMRASTVLWHEEWSKGVVGIVASRLIERYYRPTILLTRSNGHWVGSGRSVEDFDLYAALEACAEHLVQFGGHKYAAGLTLDEGSLEAFKAAFEGYVDEHWAAGEREPVLELAGEVGLGEVDALLIKRMRLFGPFGPENAAPTFYARGVEVRDARVLKEAHLKLSLVQGGAWCEAIGFGLAWKWKALGQPLRVDVAYQPDVKVWNGKVEVQLRLRDVRVAGGEVEKGGGRGARCRRAGALAEAKGGVGADRLGTKGIGAFPGLV